MLPRSVSCYYNTNRFIKRRKKTNYSKVAAVKAPVNEATAYYRELSHYIPYKDWVYCPHCKDVLTEGDEDENFITSDPFYIADPFFVFKCECGWKEGEQDDGSIESPVNANGECFYC